MKGLLRKWSLRNKFSRIAARPVQPLWSAIILLILLPVCSICAQGFQNLVPNGSFETYTQCPNNSSQIYFAAPWQGPTTNSSDYNNACSTNKNVPYYAGIGNIYPAYLPAKDGHAYSGIYSYQLNNYREYAQVALKDTLQAGVCYYVEFYAANTQYIKYRSNNIAANLSANSYPVNLVPPGTIINVPMHIVNFGNPVLPDTVSWQKISGLYQAVGNERFIIIGNFKDDSNTDTVNIYKPGTGAYNGFTAAYIYIDAVSVYSVDPGGSLPWYYSDTLIEQGDSVYIGNKMGGQKFDPNWYTLSGSYITTNAGITVSPTITTSYVVQYTVCGVSRSDTITVSVKTETDVSISELETFREQMEIYPVPAGDFLEVMISDQRIGKTFTELIVINQMGQAVKRLPLQFEEKRLSVNTAQLEPGIYTLQFKNNNSLTISKCILIIRE